MDRAAAGLLGPNCLLGQQRYRLARRPFVQGFPLFLEEELARTSAHIAFYFQRNVLPHADALCACTSFNVLRHVSFPKPLSLFPSNRSIQPSCVGCRGLRCRTCRLPANRIPSPWPDTIPQVLQFLAVISSFPSNSLASRQALLARLSCRSHRLFDESFHEGQFLSALHDSPDQP